MSLPFQRCLEGSIFPPRPLSREELREACHRHLRGDGSFGEGLCSEAVADLLVSMQELHLAEIRKYHRRAQATEREEARWLRRHRVVAARARRRGVELGDLALENAYLVERLRSPFVRLREFLGL